MLGALIGMLIVMRAVQAGIPRVAIARMMTNIAIDTFVGSIPIFGDAFDFVYKSNIKNLRIYEDALQRGAAAPTRLATGDFSSPCSPRVRSLWSALPCLPLRDNPHDRALI